MQGASPLASPGLGGARHGLNLRSRHPAGAYPRRWWLDQPLRCPARACLAGRLPTPPLACFSAPIPPPRARRALFPAGRGDFSFLMQGASPLASPGLDGARHGLNLRSRHPAGGRPPRRWRLDQPLRCPAGGLPGGVPAYPAVSLLCFPLSPCPLPRRGRGRFLVFLCKGLRPLHPRGWVGRGTGIACGKPVLSASNGALAPAGAAGTRVVKSPPPVHLYAGSVSAVGGSVQGCRGRSPRQNKLWAPPFPPGRGAGGWGQNQSQRQGRHATRRAIPRKGACGSAQWQRNQLSKE